MKIAHVSDPHYGLNYPGPTAQSRFDDICRVMDWVADKIIEEQCDVVAFAGDAFKDSNIMLNRASVEIKAFAGWLRKLSAAGIQVVAISGTPSHDAVAAYELIQEMQIPGVTIFTKPGIFQYKDYAIACLPGLNRSALVAQDEYRGLQPEQVHQLMTEKLTQVCMMLRTQYNGPMALMSHMTYTGSDTGFEDLLMQNESVLTKEAAAGFDLVMLGHIHRPQEIDGKVYYSGSPERLSFNDEKVKAGFYIHEPGNLPRFIDTPARRYLTLDWHENILENIVELGAKRCLFHTPSQLVQDAIIRIRYTCSEEINKQLNRKEIEKAFYDGGAYFVSEIKGDIQRIDRARDKEISDSLSPDQAVTRWARNQGIDEAEAAILAEMTRELMGGEGAA